MRKLIYYVAATLDGFIAREDGSFDAFPWDDEFGGALMASFPETFPAHLRPDGGAAENRWFDAVLMGRKTYEVGLREGITSPYPTLKQYVFSRSIEGQPDESVALVRDDAVGVVERLKAEDGKAIWLCGGSELAGTLLSAGLIDGLIVKLNPVVFGSGIPLFGRAAEPARLELTQSQAYPSSHLLLHYDVER